MFPLLGGAGSSGNGTHHQQLRQHHRSNCVPEASCQVGDVRVWECERALAIQQSFFTTKLLCISRSQASMRFVASPYQPKLYPSPSSSSP